MSTTGVSDSIRDNILNKVRKMMERAKDPAAPEGEAETAINMVKKLMEQFNIEDAEVFKSEEGQRQAYESMTHESAMERREGGFHEIDKTIAHAVANVCGTNWFMKRTYASSPEKEGRNKGQWINKEAIVFWGFPRDVAVSKALYQELWASWTAMARYKCGKGWGGKHTAYGMGFAHKVWTRSYYLKKQSQQANAGSVEAAAGAIVLAKEPMLKRYGEEKLGLYYPKPLTEEEKAEAAEAARKYEEDVKSGKIKPAKIRVSRKKDYSGTSAYSQGYADGEHASLGTNGISGKGQGRME